VDLASFCHTSTGTALYDPGQGTKHFEPWWALLLCDEGILEYHAWLMRRQGVEVEVGSRWGAHICFVRGEQPADLRAWGVDPGPITFQYTPVVDWTNGYHAWLWVWSPQLTDLRQRLGLPVKPRTFYHLTIGRLVVPRETRTVSYDYDDVLVL
jgi:hypothetical protein